MIVLGIESSAYTLGIGIIEDKKILADKRYTYIPKPGEGLIPSKAQEEFTKALPNLLKEALEEAKINIKDIDLIGVTIGPGIESLLKVGITLARFLNKKYKIEAIGVNHVLSHIEVGKFLTNFKDPIILYVSGGNTQIISFNQNRYRIFGETLDEGIGNMFDKIARKLKLPFPGGKNLYELIAKKGKNYILLPYNVKGMDVNLSGLETFVLRNLNNYNIYDLIYSLFLTSFSMLLEISERAIFYLNKDEFMIVGGVGANELLNEMAKIMARENNIKFKRVDPKYCVDNGIMVAITAKKLYEKGIRFELKESRNFRIENIELKNWLS